MLLNPRMAELTEILPNKADNMAATAVSKAGDKMAWVSVHDNVIGGKLRELAKEIKCTQEEALGILVSLWLWGLNNADKDGRLMSADREDVLEAFSVKLVSGLKVDIVEVLVKTRWMDEPEPGALYIHDWDQWQKQWYKAMELREKDAKRKAESRRAKSSTIEQAEEGEQECFLQPEPENGIPKEESETPRSQPEEPKYAPAFNQFWDAYPRKIGKGEAYKKYKTRRRDGYSDEELLGAAKAYAIQCRKSKTEKEFIKHPKTFLSDNLPFLDYLPKKEPEPPAPPNGNQSVQNPFGHWEDDT